MKSRVSRECWDAEMLCRRPSVKGAVFPRFEASVHVREDAGIRGQVTLAMDFGFAAPLVCLWIVLAPDGRAHVIDEYLQPGQTMDVHLEHIAARKHGPVAWLACDPAGASRNDQTAASNVQLLKHAGYSVRHRRSGILEGVELVRAALSPASGEASLFIHPRCKKLIRAMTAYRYPEQGGELPLKDGEHDHPIDALRYHLVNRDRAADRVTRY